MAGLKKIGDEGVLAKEDPGHLTGAVTHDPQGGDFAQSLCKAPFTGVIKVLDTKPQFFAGGALIIQSSEPVHCPGRITGFDRGP